MFATGGYAAQPYSAFAFDHYFQMEEPVRKKDAHLLDTARLHRITAGAPAISMHVRRGDSCMRSRFAKRLKMQDS